MAKKRLGKNTEYTVTLGSFSGVDRDSGNISDTRLSEAINMYRDYDGDGGGVIESIPGYRQLYSFGSKIKRIYRHKTRSNPDVIVVHTEDGIYSFGRSEMDSLSDLRKSGTVSSGTSSGFSFKDDFYLLDGKTIHILDIYGSLHTLAANDASIYVPTTYINGVEYEQRNLLTDAFLEEYKLEDPYRYATATKELIYTVTDPERRFCSVTGIQNGYTGDVFVPKYATIDATVYEVRSIGERAFQGQHGITSVVIAPGVYSIGDRAFESCSKLKLAALPDSTVEIGEYAFASCGLLEQFYLGGGATYLARTIFNETPMLTTVHYSGSPDEFYKIPDVTAFLNKNVDCFIRYGKIHVTLPIHSPAKAISGVSLSGSFVNFTTVTEDGKISALDIVFTDGMSNVGKVLLIKGTLGAELSEKGSRKSFLSTVTGMSEGGFRAITKCTVAVLFDGRIFYSGNPKFPNTVFYTERDSTGENNPLYVGSMNFFNDGLGAYPVTSLLAVRDALAVFKGGDDGGGSIFYHTPLETGDSLVPKAYPVAYVHSGVSAHGPSLSFFDDPVFLSPLGLSALAEKNISYERNVACRSHNVNSDLLKEDLTSASMAVWLGYLAVCTRGRIYLADSRAVFRHETGNIEYEWFILDGIGCYENDARVFKFSSNGAEGYKVHKNPDTPVSGIIYTDYIDGNFFYYTYENDGYYAAYPTDEWSGGDYSPAVTVASCEELLFFGTERGELCVFNNDKRGVAPSSVASAPDFDPEEYKQRMGRRIHEEFYSFDRHAPTYLIKTKSDDCKIPHLSKSTVKGSLVLKCKGYAGNKMHLEVETDSGGYREIASFTGGGVDFSSFDFSALSFGPGEYSSIPFSEREKNWVEKQITVKSSEFASPIGILSISYRFTVKGNIKPR